MSDHRPPWRRHLLVLCGCLVVVIVALVPPLYLDTSELQIGLFIAATAVAGIGLTLLSGTAGQLSLGHSFFVAVGAYGYVVLSSHDHGAGLPTALASVLAVGVAGITGALFSPVANRIRGLYLGIASLALVYLGQHLLANLYSFTGGYDGRDVPPLRIAGLHFSDASTIELGGVVYGQYEMLWVLGMVLLAATWWFARGVITGRQGRALAVLRDSEAAAAVMGVDIRRAKTSIFVLSSAIAGAGGVFYALTVSHIVPDSFGLTMAIDLLAIIVIGGLGSPGGAIAGAAVVTGLPLLFTQYSNDFPFLSGPGQTGGLSPHAFAEYIYGGLVVVLVLVESEGLVAVGRHVAALVHARSSVVRSE